MRRNPSTDSLDAREIAALWPCMTQVGAFPLPDEGRPSRTGRGSREGR